MLAHDILGDPAARRTAVMLHGILGSKNNWRGICARALERVQGLRCAVVDLRGHGRSHGFAPPHTVEACALDVLALGLAPQVVVGHSFGGKVALALARLRPAGVEDVVVLDTPPGTRPFTAGGQGNASGLEEIDRVLAAVRAVPMPIASRRALVEALRARRLSEPIAQWMTTNLVPAPPGAGPPDALTWTFDLDVIGALLASFAQEDFWPFLESHGGRPRIHIVRAGRGARFSAEDVRRLDALALTGRVEAHVMERAGHWLHTDDPEGLLALLEPILRGAARE